MIQRTSSRLPAHGLDFAAPLRRAAPLNSEAVRRQRNPLLAHQHRFGENWPFADATTVAAITTSFVADRTLPVLLVTHDEDDGTWQVLCGTSNDPQDGRVMCLGCLYELDPTIGELADLPLGWVAWRSDPSSPWYRESHSEYVASLSAQAPSDP